VMYDFYVRRSYLRHNLESCGLTRQKRGTKQCNDKNIIWKMIS
jgi:hypothetical protein